MSSQGRKSSQQAGSSAAEEAGKRETRGDVTRARLVEAAIACVARYGLEGTTVTRLVEASGLSRGLISFHFDGKDQLLNAALSWAISHYEESWEAHVVRPALEPRQRLYAVIEHDLAYARDQSDILALWWAAWGETRAKEIYRASSLARDRKFVADLGRMFRRAGLAEGAAKNAAVVLNAAVLGFWLQCHLDDEVNYASLRRIGHDLVEALLERVSSRPAK